VVDHGHIVEQGTHQELLRHGGHYAALWQASPRFIDAAPEEQATRGVTPDRLYPRVRPANFALEPWRPPAQDLICAQCLGRYACTIVDSPMCSNA